MHQQYGDMQTGAAITKARRGRKPRAEPITNTRNERVQTRASGAALTHQQNNDSFANHYSMTQDRNRSQILYTYSNPRLMSTSKQSTEPTITYSKQSTYYNVQKPPVSLQSQYAQQVTAPVEYALPKQVKKTQANLTVTDIEMEMIKLLRSKGITELSQLRIILAEIDRSKKVSEDKTKTDKLMKTEICNLILEYSNKNRSMFINYLKQTNMLEQSQTPNIAEQQTEAIKNPIISNQMAALRSLPQYSPRTRQENMSPDIEIFNSRTPNQQQVPDAFRNENYPISTLVNFHQVNGRNRPSASPLQVQNFAPHLMPIAAPYSLNSNQYEIPEYLQNRPSFPNTWWPKPT